MDKIKLNTFLIITICVVTIESMLIFSGTASVLLLVASRFLQIGCVMVFVVDLDSLGLSIYTLKKGVIRGSIWSFLIGLSVGVISLFFYIGGVDIWPRISISENDNIFTLLAVGSAIGPIAEELYFRGVLFGYLRRFGFIVSLIFSSLVFTFLHQEGILLFQFVGGVLFAVSYEIEKNLVVPIVIHIIGNLVLILLFY
ncbi:MAG: CPBP family intramembrane metalloprotease [Pseudomonadales bacterium]|nr:CPBP family intramembrane metalloprotease [Pseudomonadales bacterium]